MTPNQSSNEEEVALGQFFSMFANFIKWIILSIYQIISFCIDSFVQFLVFIRKYWIYNLGGLIIGIIAGYILISSGGTRFRATMSLKTNFNSSEILYKNLDYYNDLLKQKNYATLSKELGIEEQKVSNLRQFFLAPNKSEKQKAVVYKDYIEAVDTNYFEPKEFIDFFEEENDCQYRFHNLTIVHNGQVDCSELSENFSQLLAANPVYLKKQKELNQRLKDEFNRLENEFAQLDSLRKSINIALINSGKTQPDQVLSLQGGKSTDLSWVYDRGLDFQSRKNLLSEAQLENTTIAEVVTPFPILGEKESIIKPLVKFGLYGLLLSLFIISCLRLNSYLAKQGNA